MEQKLISLLDKKNQILKEVEDFNINTSNKLLLISAEISKLRYNEDYIAELNTKYAGKIILLKVVDNMTVKNHHNIICKVKKFVLDETVYGDEDMRLDDDNECQCVDNITPQK